MGRVFRSLGAVIAGLVVGALLIGCVEAISSRLYPLPPGVSPTDAKALESYIKLLPAGAFLLVLGGWAAGSFSGSLLATRLARGRRAAHGMLVGIVFLIAGVGNMLLLPHPIWFWAAALVVFPLFTYLGSRAAGERP